MHVLQLGPLLRPAHHDVVLRDRNAVAPRLPDHVQHRAVVTEEARRAGRPVICRSEVAPKLSVAGLAVTIRRSASTTSAG